MTTFDTLARDLASRFNLGDKASPFLRMLLAHMTNPDKGGLPGFMQHLRQADWTMLDSWLGQADLATSATDAHIERAFGGAGGLIGAMTSKLGLGRDTIIRALGFAVPALLGRLTPGGTVSTVLTPETTAYIGDRREWLVPAATVAPAASTSGGMGWLPWVAAAVLAALLLGWCALQKPTATTDTAQPTPNTATVPAPSGATPSPVAQASEEPAGAGILAWRLDDMPALKVYFDSGSAAVSDEFTSQAKELVDYLAANPDAKAAISGFNDPTGDPEKNAELSKNRAEAVKATLETLGVAADRLELRKPADTTGTADTNAASRRVEVTLFR
ncbi:MAG: OmpA family protein [Pseudomonadota bacterium]|nr:OmpA family protein [Pseudomonadota bacterium]